jgi:hypothetical protein
VRATGILSAFTRAEAEYLAAATELLKCSYTTHLGTHALKYIFIFHVTISSSVAALAPVTQPTLDPHHHSIATGAAILFTSTSRRRQRRKSFFSLETALTLTSLQPQTLSSHPAVSATSTSDASSTFDTSVVDSDDHHTSNIMVKVSSGYPSRRQDWQR